MYKDPRAFHFFVAHTLVTNAWPGLAWSRSGLINIGATTRCVNA